MAGTKFEHSLSDKARAFEELQQRAEKFQQFTRSFSKEMVGTNQQFMQMLAEYNRLATGSAGGAASLPGQPIGLQTAQGKGFAEAIQRTAMPIGGARTSAEVIVLAERTRQRNAKMVGLSSPNVEPIINTAEQLREAHTEIVRQSLSSSINEQPGMSQGDPEKQRRKALMREYANRMSNQSSLKERLSEKYGERIALSGSAVLSEAERGRADYLAATGQGTHHKYDLTDVPMAMQTVQKFEKNRSQYARTIESLGGASGPGTEANKGIVNALQDIVKRMEVSNQQYGRALEVFGRVSNDKTIDKNSEEYKRAINELRVSLDDLNSTEKELNRTEKAAAKLPGGQGTIPPTGSRILDFMRSPRGTALGAAFGAGAAVIGAGFSTVAAMDSAVVGAERSAMESRGAAGAGLFAQTAAAHDMTNVENLIKYRGDVLFGRRSQFLGVNPTALSRVVAEETTDFYTAARSGRNAERFGAVTSAIVGTGKIIGGSIATAGGAGVLGIPLAGSGAADIAGAAGTWIGSGYNSYNAIMGKTPEAGLIGAMNRGSFEEGARRNRLLQSKEFNSKASSIVAQSDSLRTAEMNAEYSNMLKPLQEYNDMVGAQQTGVSLVGGGYNANRRTMLNYAAGGGGSLVRTEMNPAQYMQHMDMLTNVLGSGRRAGIGDTENMIRNGRAGLGSFSEIMSNMVSLNRVSGAGDNMRQWSDIMANALASGFDKSRTAQMFIQTSADIARNLSLTNVAGFSNRLGAISTGINLGGRGDEKSLALATAGMQGFASVTGQQGGLVGALKMSQIFGAGATMGTGANILSSMSAPEVTDWLSQLNPDFKGQLSPGLNRLIALQGGDKTRVRTMLEATRKGSTQIFSAMYGAFGGGNAQKDVSDLKNNLGKAGYKEQLNKYLGRSREAAIAMGQSGETGEAWFLQEALDEGAIDKVEGQKQLRERRMKSNVEFRDEANRSKRKYYNGLMRNLTSAVKAGDPMERYAMELDAFGSTKTKTIGEGKYKGTKINSEIVKAYKNMKSGMVGLNPEMEEKAQAAADWISKTESKDAGSIIDRIRGAENELSESGQAQLVQIGNWSQLEPFLMDVLSKLKDTTSKSSIGSGRAVNSPDNLGYD